MKWQLRFDNFSKAFLKLTENVNKEKYSELEEAGLIRMFEFTFELAWKTLKDYLESEGFNVASPREVIKTAFQAGYIANGELWIEALTKRNLLTHTYDEEFAKFAVQLINEKYHEMLGELYCYLLAQESSR